MSTAALADNAGGGDVTANRNGSSVDEMVEQGVPRREASRRAVRASLSQVIEVSFTRMARTFVCIGLLLMIGMMVILVWSQFVYSDHQHDFCDQPLAFMLRLIFIIVIVQGLQKDIAQHCLCYDMAQEGPFPPLRVRLLRWVSALSAIVWPGAAGYMLANTHECSRELKTAVEVIIGYYVALVCLLFVVPALFISVMLCLIRRGLVRLPRMPGAAPEGLLERLPTVDFDSNLFDDSSEPGRYASSCAVCLEDFGTEQTITLTPCGHVFHKQCLEGWLQMACSCPLCRSDLAEEDEARQP
eukprot:TRINITY_DN66003_c0_g1_i1.p1 TRINITY_DN66003_c0_g1~~TRINITY_DN66003_c0_g1_i1.p1  ORF type:complete len:299 (+),score=52.08 TRINITY_DN66003_c0_g1_i1:32-928(+)